MSTYMIKYTVYNDRGAVIKAATMKVKNCTSDGHAQNKLRTHINNQHWDMHKLVIHSVEGVRINPFKPDGGFDDMLDSLFGKSFK